MKREPLKLMFKIDPIKAANNGYDYRKVIEAADKVCRNRNCIKVAPGVYSGHGDENDLAYVGVSIRALVEKKWFRHCASELHLVDGDVREDAIRHYKERGYDF